MIKFMLILAVVAVPCIVMAQDGSSTTTEVKTNVASDSLDVPMDAPFMGQKFIRYMYKPDKRPRDKSEWGDKKYFVLEVSTDRLPTGEMRAMPFTTIVWEGEEFFVAFEVVTSFDTKEEVLKYAEENGITDIDLTDYEEVSPEDSE